MGKAADLFKGMAAVLTIGTVTGLIIFWFGILPLMATVFQSVFSGLEFLGIMAMMIILLRLVAKIIFGV